MLTQAAVHDRDTLWFAGPKVGAIAQGADGVRGRNMDESEGIRPNYRLKR